MHLHKIVGGKSNYNECGKKLFHVEQLHYLPKYISKTFISDGDTPGTLDA